MDEHPVQQLRELVDPKWYVGKYPDVRCARLAPAHHCVEFGANESHDPNPLLDSGWYRMQYADVSTSRIAPMLHYLRNGAAESCNPHPHFDAALFVELRPESAANLT